MKIIQVDLANRGHLREFLQLSFRIYKNISHWVPPWQIDERNRLNLRGVRCRTSESISTKPTWLMSVSFERTRIDTYKFDRRVSV